MKYHVNELGEAKPCKASAKECPLGEFMGKHYPSKHSAQKAYSVRVEELLAEADINGKLLKSSKKELDRLEKLYKELLQGDDTETLTKAFRDFRAQALVYGRVFRDNFVLNGRKAEMGLEKFKELPKPWSAYPYKFDPKVYYPTRWGKMEFHHGLPEDLKSLLAKELAAFSDYSYREAYEKVDGYPAYEAAEREAGREPLERDSYVVSLFQEGAVNQTKDRVFIDLETTGFDPRVGEIIEIGVVRITPQGEIKERFEERFDLESPEYRDTRGVGPTEVHKIAPADIAGKRRFSDPAVQELIGRYINDPEVILGAHNDSFERKYLNLHLDGFWENHSTATAEQRESNSPLQDTMLISTFLEHSTENNRLQGFAEGNGVPYENAHSALADAEMTAKAYVNFKKKLTALPKGQRPLPQESTPLSA